MGFSSGFVGFPSTSPNQRVLEMVVASLFLKSFKFSALGRWFHRLHVASEDSKTLNENMHLRSFEYIPKVVSQTKTLKKNPSLWRKNMKNPSAFSSSKLHRRHLQTPPPLAPDEPLHSSPPKQRLGAGRFLSTSSNGSEEEKMANNWGSLQLQENQKLMFVG